MPASSITLIGIHRDNASQDASMRLLEEQYAKDGRLEFIRLDDNYGFSRANNEGISRAKHTVRFSA